MINHPGTDAHQSYFCSQVVTPEPGDIWTLLKTRKEWKNQQVEATVTSTTTGLTCFNSGRPTQCQIFTSQFWKNWGLPWQSSGWRLCFPMQGAWVWSLVRELRFHMSWNAAKNWRGGEKHNRKKENNSEKIEKIKNYFTRMHFYLTFSTTNLKFILVFHAFLRALTERPARGH